jgi:bacteriorhodopsin
MMLNRLYVFTIMTLAVVNEALAQATPPATPGSPPAPAPAHDGSGASWLWIILGLAVLAALVWYFMRGRSKTTTAGTTRSSGTSGTATSHPKVFDNDKRK